jgi:DNA-binding transcriptional LysR family regulator
VNQIEDMQTFVRIVESGSITKAAEQLNTVKSAVSRRLAELEKRLGITLLIRTTRNQVLTEHGKSYYQQSLRIIDDITEIESSMRDNNCALSGRIKIAAPLSFGIDHLGGALRKFNELHPDIYFDIDFNDRRTDLIEEGFDLAIRIAHLEDSNLIARKLAQSNIILSASPSYLAKHGEPKTPADLQQGHVKLHYDNSPDVWSFKEANSKKITVKVPKAITANNGTYLCEAAIDGVGLIYTPDFICYKAIKLGQLKPLLADFTADIKIPIYAVYPQNRHLSQRVRSLVDFLAQYFGEQPYWRVA